MEERFVTVKLLGELGRKFGREYRFLVRNPRDVISALSRQVDGFKEQNEILDLSREQGRSAHPARWCG